MKKLASKCNSKYFDAKTIILFQQIRNIYGNLSYSYYVHVTVTMSQAWYDNFIYRFLMQRFGYEIA